MLVTQKCHYALWAVFHLSLRYDQGPVKTADIARARSIPSSFLTVILNQLKQAGLVASQRGGEGGFYLRRPPAKITVGEVIRFIEGPAISRGTLSKKSSAGEEFVFQDLWQKVDDAISGVYDSVTFQDLLERWDKAQSEEALHFSI